MGGGQYAGEFEQLVLLAIARLEQAYGMTIRREITTCTGRSASVGAVYLTLERLIAKGYAAEYMSEPIAARGGRARRMVRLTNEGVRVLRTSRRIQERMWEGVNLRSTGA